MYIVSSDYLLDTNVISELRRPRPHPNVLRWLNETSESRIYLSAVTIGEIQRGIELAREKNPVRAKEIALWLDEVEDTYRILSVDAVAFREWARLTYKRPNSLLQDALIAAVATARAMTLVTRNVKDFRQLELSIEIFDPFTYGA